MAKGGDGGASAARAEEAARQERIRAGTAEIDKIFGEQFNDATYGNRRNAFTEYATPQLEDQYSKAQKDLAFYLDSRGLTDSTVRAQKEAELGKLYDTNKRSVGDQALSYETAARTNVEDARADLIRTLTSTGDNTAAVNQAISRSAVLSRPDAYSPLGDLFVKFTGALGQQAQLERASAATDGAIQPRYNTGLFGSNPNAVRVTN